MQGREGAADHGRTELVLAIRRPAVDGTGDEEVVLRPVGEDRPKAERFALVEPIGAAEFLSIEATEAKAEAGWPVLFETSVVISSSWFAGMTRFSKRARIHKARSCGFEMIAPASAAQERFCNRMSLPMSGASVDTLQGSGW